VQFFGATASMQTGGFFAAWAVSPKDTPKNMPPHKTLKAKARDSIISSPRYWNTTDPGRESYPAWDTVLVQIDAPSSTSMDGASGKHNADAML
jgi:hypothetical protein